jgi:hypothetical protein
MSDIGFGKLRVVEPYLRCQQSFGAVTLLELLLLAQSAGASQARRLLLTQSCLQAKKVSTASHANANQWAYSIDVTHRWLQSSS